MQRQCRDKIWNSNYQVSHSANLIISHLLGHRLGHMLEELDWDLVALLLGDRKADLLRNGLLDLDGRGLG